VTEVQGAQASYPRMTTARVLHFVCIFAYIYDPVVHGKTINPYRHSTLSLNQSGLPYGRPHLSEVTDPTWRQWEGYSALGIKNPGKPVHFSEMTHREVYKEWLPQHRSTPPTCVVSMYSADLLKRGAWGRYAAENNLNWALSHGYKYSIFRERLANKTVSFGWSLPRSALFMLEQGEEECEFVFSIDGDAVINNYKMTIASLKYRFLQPVGSLSPMILMACHWHQGKHDGCHNCKCNTRAFISKDCSEDLVMKEFELNSHCGVNMGVYLLRNSAQTREIMRWWAGAGAGHCDWQGDTKFERKHNLAEQKCAVRMKAKWPALIDVVHAGILNMPSWYDNRRKQVKLQVGDKNAKMDACFRSGVFICHTLGLREPQLRRKIFGKHLLQRRAMLSAWSVEHQEPYISILDLPSDDALWW